MQEVRLSLSVLDTHTHRQTHTAPIQRLTGHMVFCNIVRWSCGRVEERERERSRDILFI